VAAADLQGSSPYMHEQGRMAGPEKEQVEGGLVQGGQKTFSFGLTRGKGGAI
jgi:hypothetical protein